MLDQELVSYDISHEINKRPATTPQKITQIIFEKFMPKEI